MVQQVTSGKRRAFASALVAAGVASTLMLSLSTTGTFASLTSLLAGDTTAAAGAIVLQEATGSHVCVSGTAGRMSVCDAIKRLGDQDGMVVGNGTAVTLAFRNLGDNAASTFSMQFGECAQTAVGTYQGGARDLCNRLDVKVFAGTSATGTPIIAGTASSLASSTNPLPAIPDAGGAPVDYTVVASLDTRDDNAYQGYEAAQPITWASAS